MFTRSFEHLNKVDVRDTMDSRLEKQRYVIKFLRLEGEKSCYIFLKPAYPAKSFIAGFHRLGRAGKALRTSFDQGGPLRRFQA